jgi:hypothetical protein
MTENKALPEPFLTERITKNKALVKVDNALNGNDHILGCGYTNEQVTKLADRTVASISNYRAALREAEKALRVVTNDNVTLYPESVVGMCQAALSTIRALFKENDLG